MGQAGERATPIAPWATTLQGVSSATVLLIEADAARARQTEEILAEAGKSKFHMVWVTGPLEALQRLISQEFDIVLLGRPPPDCAGVNAFEQIRRACPEALILPLGEGDTGDQAVARYAEPRWLPQVLHYVVGHKAIEAGLRDAEETLFEEKERAQVTLNSIGDAVLVTDAQGNVTFVNRMAEIMTGWTQPEAMARPLTEVFRIVDGATREPALDPARRAMEANTTVGLADNIVLIRRDGSEVGIEDSAAPVHDRHDQVAGAVIIFRDVDQSRAVTRKMAYLAQHDALTGLANRTLLNERLGQSIRLARRHKKQIAVLFVDLDGFKQTNDSLGHKTGDRILQTVASVLTRCVRTTDTVCRQGGDEFVVLLSEIERPADAARVAEVLLTAFAAPLVVDKRPVHVTLSIGISVYPDHGDSGETLIQHADAAMYRAKANGCDTYRFFGAYEPGPPAARGGDESNLHQAFEEEQFRLHYQPQVELESDRMVGVEALVRWLDPERGLLYPRQFVPAAIQSGLIVPLGHWVLQAACRQMSTWQASCPVPLPIAVNVSAAEFGHNRFTEGVARILYETAVDPERVELELTENALMQEPEATIEKLKALKALGVQLAIDDFGTGHSSLSYLSRLPIDTIKVDRSFLRNLHTDPESAIVLRSIIVLGRDLGCRVLAEGVETQSQLEFVRTEGCHAAQGFQLGRPIAAGAMSRLLKGR